MAVLVALRVEDRRCAADVDPRESMRSGSRTDGIHGELDAARGAVLEADGHREAGGELAVDLALGRPGADGSPGDDVGDVLRRDRIEELAADRQPEIRHLDQQPAGGVEPGVHVARTVQLRVVDQALPAGGRARLLEVDAHRDAEVVAQVLSPARPAAGRSRSRPRDRGRCRAPRRPAARSSSRSRIDLTSARRASTASSRSLPSGRSSRISAGATSSTTRSMRWSRTRSDCCLGISFISKFILLVPSFYWSGEGPWGTDQP